MLNEKNKNNRKYLEEDMVPAINIYTEDLESGACVGELNHSAKPDIDLDRICHRIVSLNRESDRPNFYKGKCLILDTPLGRTLRTLGESKVRWGFSSKVLGSIEEKDDYSIIKRPQVVSVDAVFQPSIGKFANGILENVQFIVGDDGRAFEAYEKLEKSISKYPSHHKDQIRAHIVESLKRFLKSI